AAVRPGTRRGPGADQRQRWGDRARPSVGRHRRDDPRHSGRRTGAACPAVRAGAAVRRRRHGHSDHHRKAVTMISIERRSDGIAVLTIDDPTQSANAISTAFVRSLSSAVEQLAAERESLAGVIVTSAKDTFVVGMDLKEFSAGQADPRAVFTL